MAENKILWVDDEIEFLKPHIVFLNKKGYSVSTATNGDDAIIMVEQEMFDVVLLDEMMPGKDGLTTLVEMKAARPSLPVVMITKNEEESLMEEAIGSQIDDYLTKPVNPSQILLALKRIIEGKKLSEERRSRDYVKEFNEIDMKMIDDAGWEDWIDIHLKLSNWELELDNHPDQGLKQSLEGQRESSNTEFSRFVEGEYFRWVNSEQNRPPLSKDVISMSAAPHLKEGKKVVFIVVDCMRLDQWITLETLLRDFYSIQRDFHYSILPSATPYSRNSLFAGLYPSEIEALYPDMWHRGEEDESSSNRYEHQLLDNQLERLNIDVKSGSKYIKILDPEEGLRVARRIDAYFNSPLVAIVVNFVDMLAHSRSSNEIIKEMVPNEAAYRSIVKSWFEHSSLYEILKSFSKQNNTVVIMTSDHGSLQVRKGSKVISDKEASTNLRYKHGRNLKCEAKHALFIKDPADFKLPIGGINSNYIIAKESYYFVYPTNYNKYLNFFKNSFQHGGISMEEMILPVYTMTGK